MKKTIPAIKANKNKEKIVVLTAYSKRIAELIAPYTDIILVGDSLGMTLHGFDSTLPVTLEMMIHAGKSVVKGAGSTIVIVDMPFGTYEISKEQALENAIKIMQNTGCSGVKLEGAREETINFLVQAGIPVMAHIGLQPQSVNMYGGYSYRGKTVEEQKKILNDAEIINRTGAFCVVIEGVDQILAEKLTKKINIPTIGIGASPECDGQVLVIDDLLGLTQNTAKFVKHYANLSEIISQAANNYMLDVKSKVFPSIKETYHTKEEKI
jgi:3-methyl-2-oxobutanoate hydroxymethyltransferase